MPLTVTTCRTAAEADDALSQNPGAKVIGGGTVLMRAVNDADPALTGLIRVTDPAFRDIRREGSTLVLGAHVTMAQLLANREAAFLHPVARVIGGPQVRAAATVAGNLFSGPPYGDFAAALIALGATALHPDRSSEPVEGIVRRPRTKIVTGVSIPIPIALLFSKVSRVKPKGVSLMSLAAVVPLSGGRIEGARVAFNGMGAHPARATGAERALNGQPLTPDTIARASAAAAEGLDPRDDAIASAWYRRETAGIHLRRLLEGAR
ncbi:MAG: FAD binding domain-containing protein [Pseudomonadota bacterium]